MNYLNITQVGFILLCLVCLTAVYRGFQIGLRQEETSIKKKFNKRFFSAIISWIVLISLLSLSGVSSQFNKMPPPFIIVLLLPLICLPFLLRSPLMMRVVNRIPMSYLIVLQTFRIPVEIFLWLLFLENLAPVQMTFEGRNLDILVGITAPIAALLFFKSNGFRKWAALLWNIVGLILLINIVSVALLSTPTPIRIFMNEPANTIVAKFPIIFLPGILVPLAYYLHAFSIKQILSKTKREE